MFLATGKPLDKNFIELGGFKIAWYAVMIFGGAFLAYFISKYIGKKRGIKSEVYTDLLTIAFPMGLVGARLWWVCSYLPDMWNNPSFLFNTFDNVWAPFNFLANAISVWKGGLAVQGGVVLGVLSAYVYYRKKKPCSSFLELLDTIAPNILIAQAIGRWGNFFNGEVFGACIDPDKLSFLPNFIVNQQIYAEDIYEVCNGLAAQPLFLYEGILNTIGFLLISVVLRKFWTNKRCHGDLSALYFVWYGIVRISLEGFRHSSFIMKILGLPTSIWFSALFILGGVAWMILLRYFLYKKNYTYLEYTEKGTDVINEK